MGQLQAEIDHARMMFHARVLESHNLPGPTGESNRLSLWPRGVVLCLGPDEEIADKQARSARQSGCAAVIAPDETLHWSLHIDALQTLTGFDAVCCSGEDALLREIRQVLAKREGAIIPLVSHYDNPVEFIVERHVCVDTTASGGNAALLAAQS